MRLNRLLPFVAAAALAACNPQSADRAGGAARTPISPAQTQAATAADNCPKAQAPVCPGAKSHRAAGVKAAAHRKAVAHRAGVHRAAVHRAPAAQRHRTWRHYEALAGGPPRHREYARAPREDYSYDERGYDERAYDDRADAPATTYRYGPAYPPGWRSDQRDEDRGRYEARRAPRPPHPVERRYYEARRAPPPPRPVDRPPPPHEDRYGADRSSQWEEGSSSSESRSTHEYRETPVEPPRSAYRYRQGAYEGSSRYESQSESASRYESRSYGEGPCCRSEAAGFDSNGFLTWPGKVPARP